MDVDKFLRENVILLFLSNSWKLIHVTLYTKMYRKIKNQNIASLSENSSVEEGGPTQNDRLKRSKFHNLKILGY